MKKAVEHDCDSHTNCSWCPWKRDGENWKSEEELRPLKLHHF